MAVGIYFKRGKVRVKFFPDKDAYYRRIGNNYIVYSLGETYNFPCFCVSKIVGSFIIDKPQKVSTK